MRDLLEEGALDQRSAAAIEGRWCPALRRRVARRAGCPIPTRSSASASTTAPTRPRPASTRPPAPPSSPSSATRSPPSGATVPLPAASEKVDYEAEVAFVIGRRAHEVDEQDALAHVAGYMLLNDLSARDLQFATPQWMPGKVFDGSAPCGPALVTPDEAGAARRDRDRADPERRADAGVRHGRPDLLGARAGVAPLAADDARARRHRLRPGPRQGSAARAIPASG